jgi:guanylate kinase
LADPIQPGTLFVITGTSGGGKDSIIGILQGRGVPFHKACTVLTREPRAGEQHGREHLFITDDEFQQWQREGRFLEWAEVYGNRYGTPHDQVEPFLARGEDVVLRVDVQGAQTVLGLIPDAVAIFIAPPDAEEGFRRLEIRDSNESVDLERRLAAFEEEMAFARTGAQMVINYTGEQEAAADEVAAIMAAHRDAIPDPA